MSGHDGVPIRLYVCDQEEFASFYNTGLLYSPKEKPKKNCDASRRTIFNNFLKDIYIMLQLIQFKSK